MTSTAALPRTVLIDRIVPRSIAANIGLVVAGAAVMAALSQLVIPMWPVPITGQTLAALLVGASLGWARGASAITLYAVVGLLGAPISAPKDGVHLTGLAWLTAPSFGYVIGMILAAAFVGWLAQLKWDRVVWKAILAFLGGEVIIYAIGLPWLAVVTGGTPEQVIAWGLTPFIIGDVIKAAIAAALLPAAWWAVKRIKG
ncbi:MAG: biotin transporter BioY [Microbacteriaceae bacterium]|nr:biotin transporter BioY [Microbacteriaceae bacterium]